MGIPENSDLAVGELSTAGPGPYANGTDILIGNRIGPRPRWPRAAAPTDENLPERF